MQYLNDIDSAKEIVHTVFTNLWEKRENIDFTKPLKSYLFTSVYNRCMNYIRDNKKFISDENIHVNNGSNSLFEDKDHLISEENQIKINNAIDNLPDRCKEIFLLSRFEGYKYSEIADQLKISVKTVEAQMSKALKILKEKLIEFIAILILMYLIFF